MAKTVQVVGLREANRALRRLPDFARDATQQEMNITAFHVSRDAASRAPTSSDGSHGRSPGFMAASIRWASRPRSLAAVVTIAKAAFYWKFMEYGTRARSARPFFRPAADASSQDHQRRMRQALAKAATQVARAAKG